MWQILQSKTNLAGLDRYSNISSMFLFQSVIITQKLLLKPNQWTVILSSTSVCFIPCFIDTVYFCVGCLCQPDSPVLLWTGDDNGTLHSICNPPIDSLYQIMH